MAPQGIGHDEDGTWRRYAEIIFFILFHASRLTFLVSFLLFLIKYFIFISFILSFADGRNIRDSNDTEMNGRDAFATI